MDRDAVAACLALAMGGGVTMLAAVLAPHRRAPPGPAAGERAAARRLWLPLLPAALAWSFLLGWALQEPDASDERVGAAWIAAALAFGALAGRAALRAVRSASSRRVGAAATVGLLRPRVVISPALRARLDPDALAAARAHEEAHARHRDPLRLLAGQLAADLQWPLPGARRRLSDWREAVELARDDEARRSGVNGDDLAHAILAAAGLQRAAAGAALTGGEEGARLRHRIERLLAPEPGGVEGPRRGAWALLLPALIAVAIAGFAIGDELLNRLPGIGP